MREIKFRGKLSRSAYNVKIYPPKILNAGTVVYGDLIHFRDGVLIRTEYDYYENKAIEYFVDPDSVGQFTNCYDADDKEIYEGDYLDIDFAGAAQVIGDGYLIRDLETLKPAPEAKLHVEFHNARYQLVWRTHNGGVVTGVDLYYIGAIRKFVKVKEMTTHGTEQRNVG